MSPRSINFFWSLNLASLKKNIEREGGEGEVELSVSEIIRVSQVWACSSSSVDRIAAPIEEREKGGGERGRLLWALALFFK